MSEQKRLFEMLCAGVTPFACVQECERRLLESGFENIDYEDAWNLIPGRKYMVEHHGSTLFAFTVGKEWKATDMLRLAVAHTDHPCFYIKPNPDFQTNGYAQINIEGYGGMILNTWLDRPLGAGGRVALRSENPFQPNMVLYQSKTPLMTIPNLAIHMNREINKGMELNKQTDMMPILDVLSEEQKNTEYYVNFLARELEVKENDILDFELNLFVMEEPMYIGPEKTMISSPRIDNLSSVSAILSALIDGQRADGINLIALFHHEEIGSESKQGARSNMMRDIIKRILRNLGASEEELERAIYKSMILSADVAHALHPNKMGKADITNKTLLNKGVCIKQACNQSYATDAEATGSFCQICDSHAIPYQRYINRSDVVGGSTVGNMVSREIPVKAIDIGVPVLAMHSARELMGTKDIDALKNAVTAFFSI